MQYDPATAFAAAKERSAVPGSLVLNTWRSQFGPEAMRARSGAGRAVQPEPGLGAAKTIRNAGNLANLTPDELAAQLGALSTSYAGKAVTESSARQVAAVYACIELIAGAIATLPLPIYQRDGDQRQRIDSHPYWWLLNEQPHEDCSAATFWQYMVESRLFHGDAFAEIVRPNPSLPNVKALRPLHPLRVHPQRVPSTGELYYTVTPDWRFDGSAGTDGWRTLAAADMLHITGQGFNGLRSVSPITYAARQVIGTAIAAEEFSGKFFSSGARPDVVLQTDNSISPEQVEVLRQTWVARYAGTSGAVAGPVVLAGGLKMEQFSLSAEDSQLIATRVFQVEEIARIFGVPPHMIGHTDKTTSWGAGVENMGRGFVKFTLRRHLNKIQQEINRKFWLRGTKFFVEWDVSDLERGDLKSENEALRIAIGRAGEPGWMTQDEVRRLKLMPPKGGAAAELSGGPAAAGAPGSTNP